MRNLTFQTFIAASFGGVLLLCITFFVPPAALADDAAPDTRPATRPANPGPRGLGTFAQLKPEIVLQGIRLQLDSLKLTDDQKNKIDALFAKAKDDFAAMDEQLKDLQMRERMQKVTERLTQLKTEVAALLDPQQKDQLEKLFPANRRPGAGGQGDLLQRFTKAAEQLDLSADQKAKIDKIVADFKAKMDDFRAQIQDGAIAPQEMAGKIMPLVNDTRQQILDILTPEQRDKLHELMPPPPAARSGIATQAVN